MVHPASPEEITYKLSEAEFVAYSDLVTQRHARIVPPARSWVSGSMCLWRWGLC